MEKPASPSSSVNPINKLQEWCQERNFALPNYQYDGPQNGGHSHEPVHQMRCTVSHPMEFNGEGQGSSKQEAKKKAAVSILRQLEERDANGDFDAHHVATKIEHDYEERLREKSAEQGFGIKYRDLPERTPHNNYETMLYLKMGTMTYMTRCEGKTADKARKAAAHTALTHLELTTFEEMMYLEAVNIDSDGPSSVSDNNFVKIENGKSDGDDSTNAL